VPEPEMAAPPPSPGPPPPPVAAAQAEPGDWSLPELEQLVRERSADFPDRADEWRFYLESMAEVAAADGRLPASLDWLVWDTFGELLERREC
jgi:hypothetical protein